MQPTLDNDGWELESAIERHQANPATFDIPSLAERSLLRVGDMVKLLFRLLGNDEDGPYVQCERMWVTVTGVGNFDYQGRLESLPRTSEVLLPGDIVTFDPDHVAAVFIAKTDLRHPEHEPEILKEQVE